MKYDVGDKVKVREDLIVRDRYRMFDSKFTNSVVRDMLKFKGKIVTIKSVDDQYRIKEDCGDWGWTDEMFEGLAKSIKSPSGMTVTIIKDRNEKDKDIMKNFKIKNYKTYENRVVVVTFEDGKKEKAVCNEDDKFDLTYGVGICVLKHIFGASEYKSIIKTAMKQIKAIDKAEEVEKERKELIERKRAKAARKKAKRKEKERSERIEEMAEAFLKAINECGSDYELECNCGSGCNCETDCCDCK